MGTRGGGGREEWKTCPHSNVCGAGTSTSLQQPQRGVQRTEVPVGTRVLSPYGHTCCSPSPAWPECGESCRGLQPAAGSGCFQALPLTSHLSHQALTGSSSTASPARREAGERVTLPHMLSATKPGLLLLCHLHPGDASGPACGTAAHLPQATVAHRSSRHAPCCLSLGSCSSPDGAQLTGSILQASPSARGHTHQPRTRAHCAPYCSGADVLLACPAACSAYGPGSCSAWHSPGLPSQRLQGPCASSLPSVVAKVKCVLRPV